MRWLRMVLFILIMNFIFSSPLVFAQNKGAYLGELTWPEAQNKLKEVPIVIIPFGAGAKEHGPHLPMNADFKVMDYLCQKAVSALPVIVAPPIQHGWFPAFRDYPGTEIADAHVFQNYILEIALSLIRCGTKRIVFLNTGIFKATGLPISIVARKIRVEKGIPTLVVSWDDLENEEIFSFQEQKIGGHADEIETSIHLFLQPDLVQMEKAVTDYGNRVTQNHYPGYKPGLFSLNPKDPAYSATGLIGDPTLATKEKGAKTLEIMTKNWLKALTEFAKTPLSKN